MNNVHHLFEMNGRIAVLTGATALAFKNRLSYMEIDTTLLRKKITDDGGIVSREQIKENK